MMMEKQSTLHPRHGGIDCVSLKLRIIQTTSTIILLFLREFAVRCATEKGNSLSHSIYVFRRDSSRFNPSPVIISTHIFGQEHNARKQLYIFSFASRTRKTLRLRLACQLHDIHVGPLHSLLFRSLLSLLGGANVMLSTSVRAVLRGRYDLSSKGEGVGHKIGLDSLQ